ncbi:MAG: peptidylprolyl isomerase [bacterium]
MMKKAAITLMAVIILTGLFSVSCSNDNDGFLTSGKKIVKVNDEYITEDLINLFGDMTQIDEEQKQALIDELVNNFLIYEKAVKSDVMNDTVFVNQLELQRRLAIANQYIQNELEVEYPKEDEIRSFYQMRKGKFEEKRKIALVLLHPSQGESFADSLYDLIKRGRKSFRSVANEFSLDTISGKEGGVMTRYFEYTDWTVAGYPSIDSIAFSLSKKGDVSEPFKTQQGTFAIVKLMDTAPSAKSYADMKNMIGQLVFQQKRQTKFESYVNKLKQEADIKYYDQK